MGATGLFSRTPAPFLRTADTEQVTRFLSDAILRCPPEDPVRERTVACLAVLLLPRSFHGPHGQKRGPGQIWLNVAAKVLAAVGARAAEEEAAQKLQALCRGFAVRQAQRR